MKGRFNRPLAAHMLYAGEITDTTAKGLLAYPGIETFLGETEVTYTDNSLTITSIDEDLMGFVISATTNLFVGQCIKLGTVKQSVVITAIDTLKISVDREILSTVLKTEAVTESAYYSVYRKDIDADDEGNWIRYAEYFNIELKNNETEGRQDLVFPNGINKNDYVIDANISTKPISMLKINASNVVSVIYYFKPF